MSHANLLSVPEKYDFHSTDDHYYICNDVIHAGFKLPYKNIGVSHSVLLLFHFSSKVHMMFKEHHPFSFSFSLTSYTLSSSISQGTHDVQRATASSSADMPGTVTVQATFAVNSPALGFLVILVDSRATAVSLSSALRPNHTVVMSGLATADSYTVVVFDVESTGLPSTRAAAVDVVNVTSTEPIAG